MEKIIKKTTEKLKNGTITKDEADKILLDLFGVSVSFFCHINKGCLTPHKFPNCNGCLYLIKNEH